MKLLEKTIYTCGHESIKEIEANYYPEMALVKIDNKVGCVFHETKKCFTCYKAAHNK
jgi:hypothetical protein